MQRCIARASAVVLLGCVCSQLDAATFTVTTTNDSGTGSLRAAVSNANVNVGLDTIAFAIPPFDNSVKTLRPTSDWPDITDAVILDGYTQTNSAPNTLTTTVTTRCC